MIWIFARFRNKVESNLSLVRIFGTDTINYGIDEEITNKYYY